MRRIPALLRLLAVALPPILLTLVGLRGLGEEGHAFLQLARATAVALRGGAPWEEGLATGITSGATLLGALSLMTLPGGDLAVLWITGIVLVALATAATYVLGHRLAPPGGGPAAAILLVACPPVWQAATTLGPGPAGLAAWAGWLALASRPSLRGLAGLALLLLGGLLFLIWPPALLAAFLPLTLELWRQHRAAPAGSPGEVTAQIPLPLLGAPLVMPLVALALHPGLWSAPAGSLLVLLQTSLLADPPSLVVDGVVRTADVRLPWTWGATALLARTPPMLLAGAALSLLFARRRAPGLDARTRALLALSCVFLLVLAPASRRSDPAGLSMLLLLSPPLAALAGAALVHALDTLRLGLPDHLSPRTRLGALFAAAALVLCPTLAQVAAAHPFPGGWLGPLALSPQDDTLVLDDVVPLPILQLPVEDPSLAPMLVASGTQLAAIELERAGWLPLGASAALTTDPFTAASALRTVEPEGLETPPALAAARPATEQWVVRTRWGRPVMVVERLGR